MGESLTPVHPGEILNIEFLAPQGVTRRQVADATGIPLRRLAAITAGRSSIGAGDALRLARYLGTSPRFWVNLQDTYDLTVTGQRIAAQLDSIVPLLPNH